FVKAVTVGALQASRLESALVAGIGPLDATATLVTEALENGPRWRPVKGRPPGEFRSENTLPETGFAVDRSPDKTQGPRWVDPMTPAVFSPEVELQNPRWGALSEVFQRHLPPMINDRGAVGAVWVGLEDGFYITLPGRGIDGDLDPRNDPVYRGARTAASSVDWTADSYGRLTVARPLVAPDAESAFLGVVAVEFDAEWVIDHLLPRPLVGVPGVGSLLLDDGPMIVAATELEEAKAINPTLLEGMDEVDPETTSGYRIVRDGNGQELLYIHHRLTSMGWTHVIYGPLERLTATPEPVVPGVGAPADG
ncbi:MAG: cache domain-containing protein, partial [Myxococcota bacterium]